MFVSFSTLSLHDALPIWLICTFLPLSVNVPPAFIAPSLPILRSNVLVTSTLASLLAWTSRSSLRRTIFFRSEEHTSELQSRQYFVCRFLFVTSHNVMHIL